MNVVSKFFNYLSIIICIFTIVLLYIFCLFTDNLHYNGLIIVMYLLLFLNPISNLFKHNKKYISNIIYHVVVIVLCVFISNVILRSFNLLYDINEANIYVYDNVIYMIIGLFLVMVLSFFFKKDNVKSSNDNLLLLMILLLILSIFNRNSSVLVSTLNVINDALLLLILYKKYRCMEKQGELKKYYFLLVIMGLLICLPLQVVLVFYILFEYDYFLN